MLFSSPDYPVFLIAVFFLYALARRSTAAHTALMVLLGDIVFTLVAKAPGALWDPIGDSLLNLASEYSSSPGSVEWPAAMFVHWGIGTCVLIAAITVGKRCAGWIASDHGQRVIARGIVCVLVGVGAAVAFASARDSLADMSTVIASHGHVLVLAVLGIGIGAAQSGVHRPLGRVVILFVASSLFYQAWAAAMSGPYCYLLGLLLGTIVLDYYLALWIEGTEDPIKRKLLVIVSLISNLGILMFFKYT